MKLKIAFTGPESSGKTTYSKYFAALYAAKWHEEYARKFLLERKGIYGFSDIEQIAREQQLQRLNERADFELFDTENCVLFIWSMVKYGKCATKVLKLMQEEKFDLTFLCNPNGIPWEYDPLRESQHVRDELFEMYHQQLTKLQRNFVVLNGSFDERIETIKMQIDKQIFSLKKD